MNSLSYFKEKLGDPIMQVELDEYTEEQQLLCDIPDRVAVFKHPHVASGILVVGNLTETDRWIANYGERQLIKRLITANNSKTNTMSENNTPINEPVDMDEEIIADKELRRDLDVILQRVKNLPGSRERSLTITKLQEAVMWLGMDLKRINDSGGDVKNPYPNSKDPSNTKIDPTADGLKL